VDAHVDESFFGVEINDLDTTPSRLGATVHSPGECYPEIQGSVHGTDVIVSGKVFIPSG
jgi:hypothetical protein